jgi:MSHA pilin protein MshD
MSHMKTRFREYGVTLVELVVAIVVIGFALAGIMVVIVRNVSSSADPVIWHQAVAVAEAYLEEILTKDYVSNGTAGENRATYDDVDDYNNLANNGCLTTTAACPTLGSCACDQNGDPIAGLAGYNVNVQVIPDTLNGVAAKRVQVTVTTPAGSSLVISGYRTNY